MIIMSLIKPKFVKAANTLCDMSALDVAELTSFTCCVSNMHFLTCDLHALTAVLLISLHDKADRYKN